MIIVGVFFALLVISFLWAYMGMRREESREHEKAVRSELAREKVLFQK